jgi:dihydrolipoamide dehydrogenase/mercuric reductase
MFGPGASDLIHVIHVAIALGATLDDYQKILHIHPTFAEIFKYLIDEMTDAI